VAPAGRERWAALTSREAEGAAPAERGGDVNRKERCRQCGGVAAGTWGGADRQREAGDADSQWSGSVVREVKEKTFGPAR
jgi:hypothetical protein